MTQSQASYVEDLFGKRTPIW